jgi:hypothetical protein
MQEKRNKNKDFDLAKVAKMALLFAYVQNL